MAYITIDFQCYFTLKYLYVPEQIALPDTPLKDYAPLVYSPKLVVRVRLFRLLNAENDGNKTILEPIDYEQKH